MQAGTYLITYNDDIGGGYFRLGLQTGWTGFVPGQFGMLEVPRCDGVLLRRPFSFARQIGAVTEILYKVVGKGTLALQRLSTGATLNLLGPLGRGFSCPTTGFKRAVAVAGGYGVAPFLEMARLLREQNVEFDLFYGARSESDLHYLNEFNELSVKLHLSTVDGSVGHRGLITEVLSQTFTTNFPEKIWGCGPMGLLKAIALWSEERNLECELSVEETMGCGTGICLGCVVQNRSGHYIRACKEGPVFAGGDLRW